MPADKIVFRTEQRIEADVVLDAEYHDVSDAINRTMRCVGSQYAKTYFIDPDRSDEGHISAVYEEEITLGGSAHEIDLSAVPVLGAQDGSDEPTNTQDLDGYIPVAMLFSTNFAEGNSNSADITVAPKSGITGYYVNGGSITDGIVIHPDSIESFTGMDGGGMSAVDSSGRDVIEISGTSGDRLGVVIAFAQATLAVEGCGFLLLEDGTDLLLE